MADSLTDRQWNEWKAVAIIDGWFNPWSHTAEITASINNAASRIVVSNSSDPEKTNRHQPYLSGPEIAKEMTDFKPTKLKNGSRPADAEKIFAARQAAKVKRHGK